MDKVIEDIVDTWESGKIKVGNGSRSNVRCVTKNDVNGQMCSSIAGFNDGTVIDSYHYACHAGLSCHFFDDNRLAYVLSGTHVTGRYLDENISFTFMEWLTNHSPYRDAYVVKDMSFIKEHQLLILDPDKSQNYMVASLQATRAWTEHKGVANFWMGSVEAGVHPSIAYVLGYYFNLTDGNISSYPRSHCEWRSESKDGALISFFTEKPFLSDKTFRKNTSYYGSFGLWPDVPIDLKEKAMCKHNVGPLFKLISEGKKQTPTNKNNPFAKAKVIRNDDDGEYGLKVKAKDFFKFIVNEYQPAIIEAAK